MPLELLSAGGGVGMGGVAVGDPSSQVTSFPFTHSASSSAHAAHTSATSQGGSATAVPSYPSHYLLHSSSVIVDRNRPMFTTAELLETDRYGLLELHNLLDIW